jgi:hypothetical protein
MGRSTLPALALVAVLVAAGCLGGPAGPATDGGPAPATATDAPGATDTADEQSTVETDPRPETPLGTFRSFTFRATEATPALVAGRYADRPADLEASGAARALLENGTLTRAVVVRRDLTEVADAGPLRNGTYLDGPDGFGLVRASAGERTDHTGYEFVVKGPIGEDSPHYDDATAEATSYDELSPADRSVVDAALPEYDREDVRRFRGSFLHVFRTHSASESAFVERGRSYVADRGEYYLVGFEERTPASVVELTYRLETVAGSERAFRDHVADRYAVTPAASDRLTAAAAETLRRTVERGAVEYSAQSGPHPDRYFALFEFAANTPPSGNRALVRWNGTLYHVTARAAVE